MGPQIFKHSSNSAHIPQPCPFQSRATTADWFNDDDDVHFPEDYCPACVNVSLYVSPLASDCGQDMGQKIEL